MFGDKIKEVYGNGFDLSHNFDENIIISIFRICIVIMVIKVPTWKN